MNAPRLIHTGSVIVDIVMVIDRLPEPGGDTIAQRSELHAGGALNTIVAARRDGLEVLFAGIRGTGPFGHIVEQALAETGATQLLPPHPHLDSGFCVALVDATAERTFVTHLGAEGEYGYTELSRIPLNDGDIVYVTGYSLATDATATGLAQWLPHVPPDVTVFLDPSPLVGELNPALLKPLFARADIISCNAREARILSDTYDLTEAAQIVASWVRDEAVVIVRDGRAGCRIAHPHTRTIEHVPTFPVDAIDTNGAGDAHAGVLMAALAHGLPLTQAVQRANAAAAIAVTRIGPATAPTAAEINTFLNTTT